MPFCGFRYGGAKNNNKKSEKVMKIVAYGCQTPSAQRRSDQNLPQSLKDVSDPYDNPL